jgi:endonuclease/exonuclease/phosphatase (EEP) superfamily protein YafD
VKVISWNLLRLIGAAVEDVASLIQREKPDLLLLQEATKAMDALPLLAHGHYWREPSPGRIHGLAAWSPQPLMDSQVLPLPYSRMPGRVPPRVAQLFRIGDITFANVHLSHGQLLNRRQLLRIAKTLEGPAAVIGDYNAVGPTLLSGFKDVGPREPTIRASDIVPFRLDRCLVRGLRCADTRTLDRGASDHHPIVVELMKVA